MYIFTGKTLKAPVRRINVVVHMVKTHIREALMWKISTGIAILK